MRRFVGWFARVRLKADATYAAARGVRLQPDLRSAVAGVFVVFGLVATWVRLGPLPADLLDPPGARSLIVVDRHGETLYEARADDGSRSIRLEAAALPQTLVDATIAAEDHRFWHHPGVDLIALVRATLRNIRQGRVVEGGSTITQQVAKLLVARGAATRGVIGKLREAIVAIRLEHRFTKREILALYLNVASYGNQLTGAERASRAYFGRGVALLTPAQAAFLASLPQRPSTFNPYRDPKRARGRQERVIVQMGVLGLLPPDRVREALDEQLTLTREPAVFVAPHFVQHVVGQAGQVGRIVTTLDADLQRTVQGIIRAERPALNRIGAHNVAVVVLDNRTGEWLAWEGSGDYGDARNGGAIDGVTTLRQPGSALKPFTYAAAFEEGTSPATVLPDVPSFFPTAQEGVVYAPRNYDHRFRGPLPARRALAGSENVPAVALASRVGVPTLLRLLRSAGLTTFDKNAAYYGLGITLGDAEVRLDELVAAYSMFARGGTTVSPRFIRATEPADAGGRLISPRTAFWITDVLSDDEARAFIFGRGGSLEFPFPVAAKTGTSQAYHDNWAIGYTSAITVGVWVGNFDRRPLIGSSGVSGAGPIFHAVMLAATSVVSHKSQVVSHESSVASQELATVAQPERTTKQRVCALSGMAASPWCPTHTDEWVASDGGDADRTCTWHVPAPGGVAVRWPSEYIAWARAERLLDHVIPLPRAVRADAALREAAPVRSAATPLRVVSPPDGAVYLIDPTLRREFQTIPLRAAVADTSDIEWRVDGRSVGRGAAGATVDWPLAAGAHVVTARDPHGREAGVAIVVK
jgi:penicillin-binding protein 1C